MFSVPEREVKIVFQHRNLCNGELAQRCFYRTSEARFHMIDVYRKIGAADFAEFLSRKFRREMFGCLGERGVGIRIGDFNKCRMQVRHRGSGAPEIVCLICVRAVQDSGPLVADKKSDCRDGMIWNTCEV